MLETSLYNVQVKVVTLSPRATYFININLLPTISAPNYLFCYENGNDDQQPLKLRLFVLFTYIYTGKYEDRLKRISNTSHDVFGC